ncbi:carbohydrate-binding module family 20 domain-containing protein [Actinoplanes sp. NBRC 103695]|uniref:carbohydrate-binding module family 20 domain-containing protein n=1 Tax=Actinoplanes sp. NBRC 103695 TaxID=3032202 RepID=UPI00255348AD|nr:carbohydrate-binding module family 20 domain-containing protein [Actinoplanes sp. NBRC 103695]
MRKWMGVIAVAILAATGPAGGAHAGPASPGSKDVIVHLFQWPWASVANECATVLGPKGFGGVQVSPPQEHVELSGHPWWQDYQPVSYNLVTRRGDRAAFASMVSACHAAGVKIYVDAVINHAAGGASTGAGSGGSTYSHYAYPAVPYGYDDFHHCGRNGNDDIADWGDRWEIQNCELVDLSDLKTESAYVRSRLTAYLNDLVSLGVDGFRVDAAKHVPATDQAAVLDAVTGDPYVFSEVIEGGAGEPAPEEYAGIGDVTEFRYGDVVSGAFRDGNLAQLEGLPGRMRLASADAVAFIDNHDTQRNGRNVLTYKNGTTYRLAQAFLLAYPYGVPQVMSSYDFSGPDQGPPAAADGTTSQVSCGSGWVCEHRSVADLVAWRASAGARSVANWWSNGSNQIAFSRGDAAFIAFNRGGAALTRTFATGLAAGSYCDVLAGDGCPVAYTVNATGQATITVAPGAAVALHVGARGGGGPNCGTASISFAVNATTTWGQNVFVVGDTPELGSWNPAAAVALSSAAYPIWRAAVTLPAGRAVAYKYIKKEGSAVVWESDPNRSRTTPSATPCSASWDDTWR